MHIGVGTYRAPRLPLRLASSGKMSLPTPGKSTLPIYPPRNALSLGTSGAGQIGQSTGYKTKFAEEPDNRLLPTLKHSYKTTQCHKGTSIFYDGLPSRNIGRTQPVPVRYHGSMHSTRAYPFSFALRLERFTTLLLVGFDISRGVTGFDRKIGAHMVRGGGEQTPKAAQTSSANKVARAVLSPIQVANLQPAYALVA